jgi:nucleoid-associated protein YgaU
VRLNARGIAVTAIAVASTIWLGPAVPQLVHELGGRDFTTALAAMLALAQFLISTATLLAVALGLRGRLPRSGAIAGLLFVVAVAGPAEAGVEGLQLPDRPTDSVPAPSSLVVRPGDSLWAIATRTGTADIPAAVGAWYRANRDVIGPDPDLIVPGQHLREPR